MFLANGLNKRSFKGKPVFSNGPGNLLRNPPNCNILDSWVFENFILADEPFARAFQIFETCVLIDNNLWRKLLVSSLILPTAFDEKFKVTWIPLFIHDFNILSCELDSFYI